MGLGRWTGWSSKFFSVTHSYSLFISRCIRTQKHQGCFSQIMDFTRTGRQLGLCVCCKLCSGKTELRKAAWQTACALNLVLVSLHWAQWSYSQFTPLQEKAESAPKDLGLPLTQLLHCFRSPTLHFLPSLTCIPQSLWWKNMPLFLPCPKPASTYRAEFSTEYKAGCITPGPTQASAIPCSTKMPNYWVGSGQRQLHEERLCP